MPQHRLEHYFTSSKVSFVSSGPSFLNLPPNVRRLVYGYLAIEHDLVDLNYNNLLVYPSGQYPETRGCRKLGTYLNYGLKRNVDVACQEEVWELKSEWDEGNYGPSIWNRPWGTVQAMLLVSKCINQEMEAYVYSAIVFRICLGKPLGLSKLWQMSENALSHLQTLSIRLDQPVSDTSDAGWECPPRHIDISKKWGKQIARDWMRTLDVLARTLTPHTLSLNLVFRAQTMDDARAILEPMKRLPLLKNLGICAETSGHSLFWKKEKLSHDIREYLAHLGRESIECIPLLESLGICAESYEQSLFLKEQKMSYDGAFWITTRPESKETELSLLVQYTIKKLASMDRTVSTPFRFLDLPQEIRLAILSYTDLVSPDAVQWRPRTTLVRDAPCEYCEDLGFRYTLNGPESCCCDPYGASFVEAEAEMRYACCEECTHNDDSRICYCCHRSPAWSSSCTCLRRLCQTLFWVNSQMRWDAQTVYFNSNKIVVTSYNSQLFRELRIDDDHEWAELPRFSNLPKIELSLYLSALSGHALYHIRWLEWIFPYADRRYLQTGTRAWQDYLDTILLMEKAMNLTALTLTINMSLTSCLASDNSSWAWWEMVVLPARRLGAAGLKDFFVNLPCHGEHHERDLERSIMGNDYDSRERNKPEERVRFVHRKLQEQYAYEFQHGPRPR